MNLRLFYLFILVIFLIAISACFADDVVPVIPGAPEPPTEPPAPAVVEPTAPPIPIPTINPDSAIFRRTPIIDGQIEPGEWDQYFSFVHGDLEAWAYVNWDYNNLYIASKSTAPTDLLITLDANADGWFHGSDNYEFVARHGEEQEPATLSVSRYESHGAPGGGAPLTAAEASAFTMKAGNAPGSHCFELMLPKDSVERLDLKSGRKIGIKIAIGVGGPDVQWIPIAPLGEVQSAGLVASKSATASPLKMDVKVRDSRLTPGEELIAKINVKNTGSNISPADTIVIGGEGKTAKLLGSQLIRIEGIKPGKSYSYTFRTPIPRSAVGGSCALGVEVRADDQPIASSLLSFEIVQAYEVKLDLGKQPIKAGQLHRVSVIIKNNTQKEAHGKVKLSLPAGWIFRKTDGSKEFIIMNEEFEQAILFNFIPDADARGRAPILAEIEVGGQKLSVSGVLEIE